MIRIAAVGDIHLGTESRGKLAPALADLPDRSDLLLLAGDLTHVGSPEEAEVVAGEFTNVRVPVIAVLGNHDYQSDHADTVTDILTQVGIRVLEGTSTTVETPGGTVGIAGTKGFGGGFPPAMASCFGEPEMKAFVRTGEEAARSLRSALVELDTDVRVALTHYSPSRDTLEGERPEIHAFLGSIALAEAVDEGHSTVAIHGHAHVGSLAGSTPGGTPVRNVAMPLLGRAYAVFEIDDGHLIG
ncbi:MAG TPA: metallophosphoesterase [Acidimicrobiia bacterium]|nr:metallophosphoesterase [Acidimicrobiia bacterium]